LGVRGKLLLVGLQAQTLGFLLGLAPLFLARPLFGRDALALRLGPGLLLGLDLGQALRFGALSRLSVVERSRLR